MSARLLIDIILTLLSAPKNTRAVKDWVRAASKSPQRSTGDKACEFLWSAWAKELVKVEGWIRLEGDTTRNGENYQGGAKRIWRRASNMRWTSWGCRRRLRQAS